MIMNRKYYSADELKAYSPKFFVGTSKTIRKIIDRKNIDVNDYVFAYKHQSTDWCVGRDYSLVRHDKD